MELYEATGNWTYKVFPSDLEQLLLAESPIYIEVYASDVDEVNQTSVDYRTGTVEHVYQVYRASEQVISQLRFFIPISIPVNSIHQLV